MIQYRFCRVGLGMFATVGLFAGLPIHGQDRGEAGEAKAAIQRTIVCLGDSITEAGAASPSGYVSQLAESLHQRHPNTEIKVIGKGISGNRVPDLQQRLDRDVLAHCPATVVIYIGINDVWHSLQGKGTPIDEFEVGLAEIIGKIQKAGGRVLVCTPSVIGEKTDGSNQLDTKLDEYAAVSRKVAQATGSQLVDLRRLFLRELKIRNPDNLDKGILSTDGVHLNQAGNEFVRDCLLPAIEADLGGQRMQHIVLVKFKETTPQAAINEVCDRFRQLRQEIPQVLAIEGGYDVSPEMRNQGFTHAFLLTFAGAAERDAYLVHPAHEAFKQMAMAHVADVTVVDYLAAGMAGKK